MTTRSARLHSFIPCGSANPRKFTSMPPSPQPEAMPPQSPVQAEERRELILYATPEGRLARACATFFADVDARYRSTTAQTYPPHVTLTGFFRRRSTAVDRVTSEVRNAIDACAASAVEVSAVALHADWVGLEVQSEWLLSVASTFADVHQLEPGDDPLRLKTWLHLSLAYGDRPLGTELADYAEQASELIDGERTATWSVGLWERSGTQWRRHC